MKDRLETFVQDRRDEFDMFEPRPDLWQDIDKKIRNQETEKPLAKGKVISLFSTYWVHAAAAVSVLLLSSLLIYKSVLSGNSGAKLAIENSGQTVPLDKIAPELLKAEVYYTSIIEEKKNELQAYDMQALGLEEHEWQQETAVLDSMYLQLKKELLTNPTSDRILDALSENLQLRMRILNRQLELIQKIKEAKNKNYVSDKQNNQYKNV